MVWPGFTRTSSEVCAVMWLASSAGMSETFETTTGTGAGAEAAGGTAAAETVATSVREAVECAAPRPTLNRNKHRASKTKLVMATLGIPPAMIDCLFGKEGKRIGRYSDFFVDFSTTLFFSRSGSRSRSAITSRTTSRSMVLRLRAQARDIALKHRLLMLRGIPSL